MQKQAKNIFFASKRKKISLLFHLILLWSKTDGSFRFFFVLFSLRYIFVSLQLSTFCIDEKQAKNTFIRIEAKKILLPFRFGAKMTRTLLWP